MQQELKRGEKLVKSLLLFRKNGLKRRLERRVVEGSMMKRLSKRMWIEFWLEKMEE